ncbi:hypothetical protein FQN50_003780 [Emmonsiellopsis sp. PD_5]|nr:hypothetical protein FQN50_003780 [Emmonsiellopsis sp. PD_5]
MLPKATPLSNVGMQCFGHDKHDKVAGDGRHDGKASFIGPVTKPGKEEYDCKRNEASDCTERIRTNSIEA